MDETDLQLFTREELADEERRSVEISSSSANSLWALVTSLEIYSCRVETAMEGFDSRSRVWSVSIYGAQDSRFASTKGSQISSGDSGAAEVLVRFAAFRLRTHSTRNTTNMAIPLTAMVTDAAIILVLTEEEAVVGFESETVETSEPEGTATSGVIIEAEGKMNESSAVIIETEGKINEALGVTRSDSVSAGLRTMTAELADWENR